MLTFSATDPFPLIATGSVVYEQERRHSAQVDLWLGLQTEETEARIRMHAVANRDVQYWIGLPVESLLTPYTEIRRLLVDAGVKPGNKVVDLGAGYGRMAFVMAAHFPDSYFIGYEVVEERVIESQRILDQQGSERVEMRCTDLTADDFQMPKAQFYFLYDYGSRHAIEKTLQDLREISMSQPVTVIGRGRASRDAIERKHPWLSQVHEPRHFAHYSIYRS